MTGPVARNLKHSITYWARAAINEYNEAALSSPELIKGRWTAENVQVRTQAGDEITSKAAVYLDIDVTIGGYLADGDHTSSADPTTVDGALEVQAYRSTPDLRYMEQERIAYL